MTNVSFYLFEQSDERQVQSACRLCRKILKQATKIWWYCPNLAQQKQLDELLWTFDPTSFIPHGIHDTQGQVCISEHYPTSGEWIIFNFSDKTLEIKDTFQHIIEIVENNEDAKIIGRKKFKQYRQLNLQPRTFKL